MMIKYTVQYRRTVDTFLSQWQACSVLITEIVVLVLPLIICNIADNHQFSHITKDSNTIDGLSDICNFLLTTREENKNCMFDYRIDTF